MADEREKKIWEVILSGLAGVAGTVGATELVEALKQHAKTAVTRRANELLNDTGRPALMRDLMALRISSSTKDTKAGEQVRQWLIRAQGETTTGTLTEGDIVNLLNKLGPGSRITVLRGLGTLPSYEDFIATMGILQHDNVMQLAIKIAERMRATGGNILDEDLQAIREAMQTSLRTFTANINTGAGMLRPSIRTLTEVLRGIQ
jgi:hypothetical protein